MNRDQKWLDAVRTAGFMTRDGFLYCDGLPRVSPAWEPLRRLMAEADARGPSPAAPKKLDSLLRAQGGTKVASLGREVMRTVEAQPKPEPVRVVKGDRVREWIAGSVLTYTVTDASGTYVHLSRRGKLDSIMHPSAIHTDRARARAGTGYLLLREGER